MDNLRTGSSNRINPDRFFHVMNQGWYIFTREGVQGPYDQRNDAETHISVTIVNPDSFTKDTEESENSTANDSSDNNDSWRM
ncbi:MAG: DUF6316 family protein [Gammaproteobacteria bacterium]